jgi:hypothetical protein
MASDKYNFPDHENGNTFDGLNFEVLIGGVAKSLVGASIVMTCDSMVFSTTGGHLVINDGAAGKFQFAKQIVTFPQVRSAYPAYIVQSNTYNYEITITYSDGDVKTYIEGTWTITE